VGEGEERLGGGGEPVARYRERLALAERIRQPAGKHARDLRRRLGDALDQPKRSRACAERHHEKNGKQPVDQLRGGVHEQRGEPERPHASRQMSSRSFFCHPFSLGQRSAPRARHARACYMGFPVKNASESSMIAIPSQDPVGALVPHTLKEPLVGARSGPLAGLTCMVKDLFAIKGRKVGNGNPDFYEHATPAHETAPVIERLLASGASLTGITICDEFFYSVLGSNAHYGQPVNTRAPQHVTGGSSCGSAAAAAASMCDFALGSDAGGSIRVPASFSGLYGLRPSFGRIATEGATPMAPSYDTIGFLAREADLFRKIGHVLLGGAKVETPVKRLIIPEDVFGYTESSIDDALWQIFSRIGGALPQAERKILAGDDTDSWRDAFRVIQGFEIQSTL